MTGGQTDERGISSLRHESRQGRLASARRGPHRIAECSVLASTRRVSGLPGPSKCVCPATSSRVAGRTRSASGRSRSSVPHIRPVFISPGNDQDHAKKHVSRNPVRRTGVVSQELSATNHDSTHTSSSAAARPDGQCNQPTQTDTGHVGQTVRHFRRPVGQLLLQQLDQDTETQQGNATSGEKRISNTPQNQAINMTNVMP